MTVLLFVDRNICWNQFNIFICTILAYMCISKTASYSRKKLGFVDRRLWKNPSFRARYCNDTIKCTCVCFMHVCVWQILKDVYQQPNHNLKYAIYMQNKQTVAVTNRSGMRPIPLMFIYIRNKNVKPN